MMGNREIKICFLKRVKRLKRGCVSQFVSPNRQMDFDVFTSTNGTINETLKPWNKIWARNGQKVWTSILIIEIMTHEEWVYSEILFLVVASNSYSLYTKVFQSSIIIHFNYCSIATRQRLLWIRRYGWRGLPLQKWYFLMSHFHKRALEKLIIVSEMKWTSSF